MLESSRFWQLQKCHINQVRNRDFGVHRVSLTQSLRQKASKSHRKQ